MGKDFDPLDVLAAPVKVKPATHVSDATAAEYLETLIRETRETRRVLERVATFGEKTAFWVCVVGIPVLATMILVAIAAVAGFVNGVFKG